jgi:hypothetical protein
MNWDEFYARAKIVIPAQELKPKRCWIGVLSHEKNPHLLLEETDFVWMIGHHVSTYQGYVRATKMRTLGHNSASARQTGLTQLENFYSEDSRDIPKTP